MIFIFHIYDYQFNFDVSLYDFNEYFYKDVTCLTLSFSLIIANVITLNGSIYYAIFNILLLCICTILYRILRITKQQNIDIIHSNIQPFAHALTLVMTDDIRKYVKKTVDNNLSGLNPAYLNNKNDGYGYNNYPFENNGVVDKKIPYSMIMYVNRNKKTTDAEKNQHLKLFVEDFVSTDKKIELYEPGNKDCYLTEEKNKAIMAVLKLKYDASISSIIRQNTISKFWKFIAMTFDRCHKLKYQARLFYRKTGTTLTIPLSHKLNYFILDIGLEALNRLTVLYSRYLEIERERDSNFVPDYHCQPGSASFGVIRINENVTKEFQKIVDEIHIVYSSIEDKVGRYEEIREIPNEDIDLSGFVDLLNQNFIDSKSQTQIVG